MAIDTLQTWLDIANLFEALRPDRLAIEKPDAIAMQRFALEMREVLSHNPRLRAWVTDTNRQGRFYEVVHIARNILAKAAQWHRGLGHNYPLTRVPPTPSSLTVVVDRVGDYAIAGEDLLRDVLLPALHKLPPFWKQAGNAGRVRRCPACSRLYYATRIDQSACSKKCADKWRVWRWRHPTAEERARRKHKRYLKEEGRRL